MTLRCLILDDDLERLAAFDKWLNEPGVELTCVLTAAQAITVLAQHQFHAVFLDHDLGGETFVDTSREDCGMEVARQLKAGTITQDPRTLFVIHTLNSDAGYEMSLKIREGGYTNVFRHSFTTMVKAGGVNLDPVYPTCGCNGPCNHD